MTDHGWLVRAGNDNELIDPFKDRSMVAIGWPEVGDLTDADSRETIKERYAEAYPDRKVGRVRVDGGTLHRFANEIAESDRVLTYDKATRTYHVGNITGEYRFEDSAEQSHYPHRRSVDWVDAIGRDELSTSTKNTLGSTLTVFSLDSCLDDIERVLVGEEEPRQDEEQDAPPYIDEVESTAQELISDIISQIDPFDFEELVAAVLRAMGYAAETTSEGSDYGVDVIAHPDKLGFEDPVIKVQVKRTQSSIGNEAIGRFLGTIDPAEKGLYVSTGGFTQYARREARSSSRRVTLLDREDFIQLLLDNYEDLEQEYRTYVPLKRVYIPTEVAHSQ